MDFASPRQQRRCRPEASSIKTISYRMQYHKLELGCVGNVPLVHRVKSLRPHIPGKSLIPCARNPCWFCAIFRWSAHNRSMSEKQSSEKRVNPGKDAHNRPTRLSPYLRQIPGSAATTPDSKRFAEREPTPPPSLIRSVFARKLCRTGIEPQRKTGEKPRSLSPAFATRQQAECYSSSSSTGRLALARIFSATSCGTMS